MLSKGCQSAGEAMQQYRSLVSPPRWLVPLADPPRDLELHIHRLEREEETHTPTPCLTGDSEAYSASLNQWSSMPFVGMLPVGEHRALS